MTGGRNPASVADLIDEREVIDLLQDLVRIPSPYFEEGEITRFVFDWLDDHGLDPSLHPVSEPEMTGFEGENVIATLPGTDPDAPTVLLNGHMDTVKIVDDWDGDPFSARISDGKLFGQGACDMKGGLASLLVAFKALAEMEEAMRGGVVLTAVVDEEGPYGLGTDALIRDGLLDECDMAIVAEPGPVLATDAVDNPVLILGARGRFLYDIEVRGRAAHGSQPDAGTNAVVDGSRLVEALSNMAVGNHPRLGSGSVCPLRIEGGSETLSVPVECRLLVDRHVVMGEDAESVRSDARAIVDSLDLDSSVDVGFRPVPEPEMRYGPYLTDPDSPLVGSLRTAAADVVGADPAISYFASVGDFNYLGHRADLPVVILGPGGGNVHAAGEFVYTDEVVDIARIVASGTASLVS
ncbi:MAG: M20 family metallopeptidase [Halodesulfurarchaeum sp.]